MGGPGGSGGPGGPGGQGGQGNTALFTELDKVNFDRIIKEV